MLNIKASGMLTIAYAYNGILHSNVGATWSTWKDSILSSERLQLVTIFKVNVYFGTNVFIYLIASHT